MRTKKIWWLNPVGIYGLLLILVVYAYNVKDTRYIAIYRTTKYITTKYLILYFACFLLFVIGYNFAKRYIVVFGNKTRISISLFDYKAIDWKEMIRTYYVLYTLTIFAYIIWFVNFGLNGGISQLMLLSNLGNLNYTLQLIHRNSSHISGITTFTELGIVVVALAIMLIKNLDDIHTKNKIRRSLILIIFLSVIRAFVFSERLALIEVLVPIGISLLENWDGHSHKVLIRLLPILGVISLLLIFGLLEYGRSWSNHYHDYYESYAEFTIDRVSGYYINAINTECAYLTEATPSILPYRTFEWFWKLPFMNTVYAAIAPINVAEKYTSVLATSVNPEFNNPGGMLVFMTDFGLFFPIFYIIYGFFVGRIYVRFLDGDLFGICVYPCIYLTMLELPRFFMLGQSRGLCILLGAIYVNHRIKASALITTNG